MNLGEFSAVFSMKVINTSKKISAQLFVYIVFVLLMGTTQLPGQTKASIMPPDTLQVGIAGSAPFVFSKNASTKGIAIEIWEHIAVKKDWGYKYQYYDNVEEAMNALSAGSIDLVVGPISITSKRLQNMSFSQPFYNSSLSILSRSDKPNLWEKVKPLFSIKLLMAVAVFLIILAIVGCLLWLAERKKSPEQFPKDPINGIGTGMWLAIVTMSTTGYGDKAPITVSGRIIAGSWMIISIIFATSMVAGIASTLTLSSLSTSTVTNVEQLSQRAAATISASPSARFLNEHKAQLHEVNSLDEAVSLLKSKKVDAVVYDRPQLLYYLKNNPDEDLYIAKAEYYKQGYGFAFPLNTALVYDVNRALLELAEGQETERIINYYLDKDE
ncbi:amino acid ABC transporter substrate-binding protein, PAAT family [Saccharicrinis carchari]|uniref:Amino acid ABC transporter substrate-binding protein, PAAT family n=2 Tax=Saccharicrinis carchari TaxID=1168039 RepID=A0A521CQS9_SACCC|nr:amino acid ABC transporter substrate-binding protein, PAAT family [Saccharicrinis carchari]